tara:strand:+ start:7765 stop:8106 length:342 start_codon:yes stop_codon:yes gene_type:complete
MLAAKTIEVYKDSLYLNAKEDLFLDDKNVFSSLKTLGKPKKFKKIEIDFGGNFFNIKNLLEGLIIKPYKTESSQTEVVLNLGKLDLETRINYLRVLGILNIGNFTINYFKNNV